LKGLYAPSVIFEELGFRYIGPLNGHRLDELCDTFSRVKQMKGPRFVHIVTKKGKGYKPAEKYPELFHGIGPYDVKTGRSRPKPNSYTNVFGDAILRFARKNKKVIVITAGMRLGTGLKRFSEEIPARFFDVGICEQHAVTMAAALSLEGYIPVCAIYSTFLQRAYDQIIHDVCLQNLPVIFVLDRAGLVGEDGPTHHGPFDISYFRAIPNIIISAPMDGQELVRLLKTAISYRKGPFVIRYPKSSCEPASNMDPEIISIGKWEIIEPGKDIAIIAIGSMVKESLNAVRQLKKRGLRPILINGRFAKPLDYNMLRSLDKKVNTIFTVEENSLCGGFGSAISEFYRRSKINIEHIGVPDRFIKHGSRTLLLKNIGLTATEIANTILAQL
jgi:1-deoxy-D-xylulose-5-phosphate synthase